MQTKCTHLGIRMLRVTLLASLLTIFCDTFGLLSKADPKQDTQDRHTNETTILSSFEGDHVFVFSVFVPKVLWSRDSDRFPSVHCELPYQSAVSQQKLHKLNIVGVTFGLLSKADPKQDTEDKRETILSSFEGDHVSFSRPNCCDHVTWAYFPVCIANCYTQPAVSQQKLHKLNMVDESKQIRRNAKHLSLKMADKGQAPLVARIATALFYGLCSFLIVVINKSVLTRFRWVYGVY